MYQEKTDQEIIDLLKIHKKLTFSAQLKLRDELNQRNLKTETSELENTIQKKISEIKNLEYLKDLGFESQKIGDSIVVTRSSKAILMDIISSILGIFFCLIGIFGIIGIIGSFIGDNEFSLFGFLIESGMVGLGITGIKLLNGIKRLIDFSGFELLNTNGTIILKKRFDLKLVEIQKNSSLLDLEKQADRLILKLEKDEILNGSSKSIIQNMTLNELNRKLKTVANNGYNPLP